MWYDSPNITDLSKGMIIKKLNKSLIYNESNQLMTIIVRNDVTELKVNSNPLKEIRYLTSMMLKFITI